MSGPTADRSRGRWWRRCAAAAAVPVAVAATVAGLGIGIGIGIGRAGASTPPVPAAALRAYVAQVEKVRLPVNGLLEGADPILDGYHDQTITRSTASAQMGALEMSFARSMVQMDTIAPSDPTLARINAPYARTYSLEDSYLSSLAADLVDGDFDDLPDTQNAQRLAIIEWRTQLEVWAKRDRVALPADLQQAGRGEIAPSPTGS